MIHYSRLKDRLATNFVPFAEFEKDAAAGTLPNFSFIEPNFISGHGDYHPAIGRAMGPQHRCIAIDPPSSILGRRGLPGARVQRLPVCHLGLGLERLEHDPPDRVG